MYRDSAYSLAFYERVEGYPFSLSQFLMGLSIVATSLAVVGVWITSKRTTGQWRQRMLVMFFGAVCCGFAYLPFTWEETFLENAKAQRLWLMENPRMMYPEDTPLEIRAQEWEHLDIAIEKAERRRTR